MASQVNATRTRDLFEQVTRKIVAAIEIGAGDFTMPWHRWGENLAMPLNEASGRPYRGINTLLLWAAAEGAAFSSGRWATYRQWAAAGAQVRRGEKATPIIFWKTVSKHGLSDDESTDERKVGRRLLARVYSVFNADQVEGAKEARVRPKLTQSERISAAEEFICATGANIRHGGDCACYASSNDEIWLPRFEQFRDAGAYYSTAAHECVHWTGAKHRLNRDLCGRFGDEAYAMEELVAELGAAFIAAHLGLTLEPRPDHAAYISSWLRVLRGDPRAILTACAKAQEAVDYIIALNQPESEATRNPWLRSLTRSPPDSSEAGVLAFVSSRGGSGQVATVKMHYDLGYIDLEQRTLQTLDNPFGARLSPM